MLTGKYDAKAGNLPKGPRGLLFRQILPGLEPLLSLMQGIAKQRRKSVSQVRGREGITAACMFGLSACCS